MRVQPKTLGAAGAIGALVMAAASRRKRQLAAARDTLAGVEQERTGRTRAQHRQVELETELDKARSELEGLHTDWIRMAQRDAIPTMISHHLEPGTAVLLIAAGTGDPFAIDDHPQTWLCRPVTEAQPTDDELVEVLEAHLADGLVHAVIPATSAAWLGRHPGLDRYVRDHALIVDTDDIGCALLEFVAPAPATS